MRGMHRLRRLLGLVPLEAPPREGLDSKYERRSPHAQNALDLISGWTGSFPGALGLEAGNLALHADQRLHWALDQYGLVEGASVLELGPLEGGHSALLEARGAESVLAIEANKKAYLKCLIAKEIMELKRCRFLLGDFEKYLHETDTEFDIVLASGVLYHMQNPVHVLDRIGRRCQTMILWTHYFDPEIMHENETRRGAFLGEIKTLEHDGQSYRLYQRGYHEAWHADSYCGGPDDTHYWMERPDIIDLCERNGFNDIRVAFEDLDGPNGPSCLFYMTKQEGG
ncbi:class I SAM-dependent methyltransferase [Parasedimentitalea maritima]|uniref:Class I SAM-dependent methyltransferase n=1 Tax=Parasedimentitalea maritima TaxID=2578117 RepID=A0ABY2URW3_9RHOB|nr:class I SAM-dependent methyltransferase [Zongyanglinia marina]TLP60295.1 class I SAM-dependent methyltransferase [Zongyanglinia marina]